MTGRAAAAAVATIALGVAPGSPAAEEVFQSGCAEARVPDASAGAVLCLGWCSRTQSVAACVGPAGAPGADEGAVPLADLGGRMRLMLRDGADSRMTAAGFASALGRVTGWTVVLRGVSPGAQIVPLRRRGTWYDAMSRPLPLRGPGRLRVEADAIARRFTIVSDR